MDKAPRSEQLAAQQRRRAVRLYQGGIPVTVIAGKLKRSVSWVYKWLAYRAQHLWTRFRSGSRAPHQHPNQTALVVERRVLRLRQHLVQHRSPDARFAGVGARTIQREYRKRYGPPPSLSTIQRILNRHSRTTPQGKRQRYRPHPPAEYPNAVHATDIITRWITGALSSRPSIRSMSTATMSPPRSAPTKPRPMLANTCSTPGKP